MDSKVTQEVLEGLKQRPPFLFVDKINEGVPYTSPAAGKVIKIERGARRVFQTVVIEVDAQEDHQSFSSYTSRDSWGRKDLKELLLESGLWTTIRERPFSKNASLTRFPRSLFITAMDSTPLAASAAVIINEFRDDFNRGVEALSSLSEGQTYVCHDGREKLTIKANDKIVLQGFSGKHPRGNVGTHIAMLDPVNTERMVWHIGYQDVIAVGKLLATGQLWTQRVVSLAGPLVINPTLIRTRSGACLCDLTKGLLKEGSHRMISGSVLNGRKKDDVFCYLGAFHQTVTVIEESSEREFLGWHSPGFNKFSAKPIYFSRFFPGKEFSLTSLLNGSKRAMVPIGTFEKVMPLEILPTQLLRALLVKDTDQAQLLGALELDEEDLALCTFVDSGKVDYGPVLRDCLTIIEKEG